MLTQLALRNFKSFKSVAVPLANLTLLSGLNGSGKSTILQAFGLLRQSYDAGFLVHGDLALNGDLVDLGTVEDVLNHSFDEPEIKISISSVGGEHKDEMHWSGAAGTQLKSDVFICDVPVVSPEVNSSLFGLGFQFLRADRITPAVTFPKSLNAIRHNHFLGPRGEFTAHYLLEFGSEKIRAQTLLHPADVTSSSLLGQVNAWLQEFSPGVRVDTFKIDMTDFVRLAYSYRGTGASYGGEIRPTNVGFGLTHSLPIVTACLGAQFGTLLLVENPEAQLHPRGQFAIGRLLALTAASGVQVLVESHSDHVLNGIRLAVKEKKLAPSQAALHFFNRQPGGHSEVLTPRITEDGRLSEWPVDFFDQWERSLDMLLE